MKQYNVYEVIKGHCIWVTTISLSDEQVNICKSLCKQINGMRVLSGKFLSALTKDKEYSKENFLRLCLLEIMVRDEKKDVVIDLRSDYVIPTFLHYEYLKSHSCIKRLVDFPADGESPDFQYDIAPIGSSCII